MTVCVTKEQYLERLARIKPNVSLIGPYINMATKTEHQCKCGKIWNASPDNVLNKHNSYSCSGDGKKESHGRRGRTHEEFVAMMTAVDPLIKIIGRYTGSLVPVRVLCLSCLSEYDRTPNIMLQGSSCTKCKRTKHFSVANHEEYVKRLEETCPHLEVIDSYINKSRHVLHKCKCCNYEQHLMPKYSVGYPGIKCKKCRACRASIEAGKHTIPKA